MSQHPRGFAVLPLLIALAAFSAFVAVGFIFTQQAIAPTTNTQNSNIVACTDEAKICPDGSAVGRTGPNCEFAECPTTNTTNTNAATNSNPVTNTNSSTPPPARYVCTNDSDCGLLICSGCFAKSFLKTAPPDLACRAYEGYECRCQQGACTEVAVVNADWKTHTDAEGRFQLRYPKTWTTTTNRSSVGFVDSTGTTVAGVEWIARNDNTTITWPSAGSPVGDAKLGDRDAKRFEYSECGSNGSTGFCRPFTIGFVTILNAEYIGLFFHDNDKIDATERAVLDSFKFLYTNFTD
jgi:hypothetical protein